MSVKKEMFVKFLIQNPLITKNLVKKEDFLEENLEDRGRGLI
jgi:hypothetical protein